ncbi:MAG TPA: AcvB/VirJ family lysyl-phosphatidylglycerol hydrolase [Terriglobales bacterium]|nr:AcvB/VirJ family lysyl-phosphatidylglycerol hydrolase [Terriglobales bacterium]
MKGAALVAAAIGLQVAAAAAQTAAAAWSELPSARRSGMFAILLDDGTGAGASSGLGAILSERGVPVARWDCGHYLAAITTAETAASALANAIEHYSAQWRSQRVLLIGQERCAAILPLLFQQLSPAQRAKVVQLSLLDPTASLPTPLLADRKALVASLNQVGGAGVQCLSTAANAICDSTELTGAEKWAVPSNSEGISHSDIARRVLAGARRRSGGRNQSRQR